MRGTVYGNAVKLKNIDVFDTQGAMNIKLEFVTISSFIFLTADFCQLLFL